MVNTLDLEVNVQPMVTAAAEADRALTRLGTSAFQLGERIDGGSRSISSFAVNSLQAINNVSNLGRSFVSLSQNTTSFGQAVGSMGVEVGLLAGNFIHLYQASAQATGASGIGGLFAMLRANPFVAVVGTLTLAAQAMALFSSSSAEATRHARELADAFRPLAGVGNGYGSTGTQFLADQASALRRVSSGIQEQQLSGLLDQFKTGGISVDDAARLLNTKPDDSIFINYNRNQKLSQSDFYYLSERRRLDVDRALKASRGEDVDRDTLVGLGFEHDQLYRSPLEAAQERALRDYRQSRFKVGLNANPDIEKQIRTDTAEKFNFEEWRQNFNEVRDASKEIATNFLAAFDPTRMKNAAEALHQGLQAIVSGLFQRGAGAIAGGIGNLAAGIFAGSPSTPSRGV